MVFWCTMFLLTGVLLCYSGKAYTRSIKFLSGISFMSISLVQILILNNILIGGTIFSYFYGLVLFSFPILLHNTQLEQEEDVVALLTILGMNLWEVNHFIYYLYDFYIINISIDESINLLFFALMILSTNSGDYLGKLIRTIRDTFHHIIRSHNNWTYSEKCS